MENVRVFSRELWRWFLLLVIANELDLAYTYVGLSRGVFQEANPILRPHLYTWWPIALKVIALTGLALGIAAVVRHGFRRQQMVLEAVRITTAVYLVILVIHVVYLLTSIT